MSSELVLSCEGTLDDATLKWMRTPILFIHVASLGRYMRDNGKIDMKRYACSQWVLQGCRMSIYARKMRGNPSQAHDFACVLKSNAQASSDGHRHDHRDCVACEIAMSTLLRDL